MPSTREIVTDFLRNALSPGGRFVETITTLLFKPGELTRAYITGQRQRYVHPVRVYLLCVFVFVAASALNNRLREWKGLPSFEAASAQVFTPEQDAAAPKDSKLKAAGVSTGQAMRAKLPDWLNAKIAARAGRLGAENTEAMRQRAARAMTDHYSLLFALMVPVMALVNRGLYWKHGVNYASHFVLMLHFTAASCLMLVPAYLLNLTWLYYPLMLLSMAWAVLASRRVFAVGTWPALWRYVVLNIPTLLLVTLLGAVTALVTIVLA
jgi:hypothetical protein